MTTITKVISDKDLSEVVRVHNSAFKGFFLTELGTSFLKHHYQCLLHSEEGVLIGAYQDDCLIGFCAACTRSSGFNTRLVKQNFVTFGLIGLKLLFSRPKSLYRLYKNFTKTGNTEDAGDYAK